MRVFLTGGTGFIGSHILNESIKYNYEIIALKRKINSKTKVKLISRPIWKIGSLNKTKEEDLKNIDTVLHLASHSANVPYDNLNNCLKVNLFDTINFFEMAYKCGVRKFIITGSCFEYGKKGEEYTFIPPSAPLLPTQTYPASKAAASIALIQWALEKKVSLSILRLFQIYGEGEFRNRLWPTLINCASSGDDMNMTLGEQIRDFLHVKDAAKIILDSIGTQKNKQIIVRNIGSGVPIKIRDFAEKIWSEKKAKGNLLFGTIPYRDGEVMRYVPDINSCYIIS